MNADTDAYPPPKGPGWNMTTVGAILGNPKYTGHMVFGRRRTTAGGRTRYTPQSEWLWSPEPAHPAIVTREVWDAAQAAGADHGTARDGQEISAHPAARRTFVLRNPAPTFAASAPVSDLSQHPGTCRILRDHERGGTARRRRGGWRGSRAS
jgi:hypothetical protein